MPDYAKEAAAKLKALYDYSPGGKSGSGPVLSHGLNVEVIQSAIDAATADLRAEVERLKRENSRLKTFEDGWRMLTDAAEALSAAQVDGSAASRDQCLNAYIEVFQRQKRENAELREQLKGQKAKGE